MTGCLVWVMGAMVASAVAEDLTHSPSASDESVGVRIQVVLIDLERVNGADQSFTANFAYIARWNDPRLKHPGPGNVTRPLDEIWHPRLQIVNRQSLQETFSRQAVIAPDGGVTTMQRVWGQFSQPLELHDFPLDRQTLHVDLVGGTGGQSALVFVGDPAYPSSVSADLSISDWEVTQWSAEPIEISFARRDNPLPAFRLALSIKRGHGYHLVNIVLPLIMIICMSWVVFWIHPKNINPRVSVSVTAMLTLIAYRFAVGASLPKISYLTRMDWFILGSSVLVFSSLLGVIITSYLNETGREAVACRLNRWMRVLAPVALALILLGSLVV